MFTALDMLGRFDARRGWIKPGLIAAALAAQALAGVAAATFSPRMIVEIAAGIAAVAVIARRPALAGLAIVVLSSTIFTLQYVPKPVIHGVGIYATELIIAGYIAYRVAQMLLLRDRAHRLWLPEIVLGLFLFQVLLSVYLGVASGQIDQDVARDFGRRYLFYAVFFVFAGTLTDGRTFRRTLTALQVLAAITSVMTIIQAMIGRDPMIFFGSASQIIQGAGDEYPRVRPPGFFLAYALFVPTLALLLATRGNVRRVQGLFLALFSVAILISLQRAVWVALPVGVVVYIALGTDRVRVRALKAAAWVIVAMIAGAIGASVLIPTFAETAFARLAEIGTERDINTIDKMEEYRLAFRQIRAAPAFGNGPGIDYGAVTPDELSETSELIARRYTHNSFVNLTLYFGLAGLVSYLAFVVSALWFAGLVLRSRASADDRNLAAAMAGGVVVVLVSGLGTTVLDAAQTIAPLAFLLAGPLALYRTAARAPHPCEAGAHDVAAPVTA